MAPLGTIAKKLRETLQLRGVCHGRGQSIEDGLYGGRSRRLGSRESAWRARGVPVHARAVPVDVYRAAMDHPPVRRIWRRRRHQPAVPGTPRWRADRAFGGVRPAHPDGIRLGSPDGRRRGGKGWCGHRLDRGHAPSVRSDPSRRGDDLDDHQRHRSNPAAPVRAGRDRTGCGSGADPRHGAERHLEGVHRKRNVHLSARAVDAARYRPVCLLRRGPSELEHDLDQRVPHPRGRIDRRPGDCVHHRRRSGLCRSGPAGRARPRGFRPAPFVLLERPQRALPRSGEVSGRKAALGTPHA